VASEPLTLKEAAERVGVSSSTLRRRAERGAVPEVDLASRVVARARGGEVLVTDSVVEAANGGVHLRFEGIGHVKLKGFDEPRRFCRATARES
jgi:class 3 adenylate cyclase